MNGVLLISFVGTTFARYVLQSNFSGPSFFDNFNFYNSWDPTYGFVHYVDRATAQSYGLINTSVGGPATFSVEHNQILDPEANLGRLSVRITTVQSWTHGLFIVDLAHMPDQSCGLWPAFWSLGQGPNLWPSYGEIDIIEYLNLKVNNSMALHTAPGCTIAGSGQAGTLLTNDCGKDNGVAGCYVEPSLSNNAGKGFNANGGGVYAMEWTSVSIRIWFFPRHGIPQTVHTQNPDPLQFGPPGANFEGSCDIDTHFFNHSLIFNTEFCGSWAGPTFVDDGCPALDPSNQWRSCNMFVAANPQAYTDAYWAVNYLRVYTTEPGTPPPATSILSSVMPAASTATVTVGGAEGTSTTTTTSTQPLASSFSSNSAGHFESIILTSKDNDLTQGVIN